MKKTIKTAVFPVGGFGTRFLPATKSIPKEMLPIANKPLIQYAFEEAKAAGIENFIFVTGRNKNAIINHFDHAYELQKVLDTKQKVEVLDEVKGWLPKAGHIAFVRQLEPLGLGHAVWCAREFLRDKPFAVILADEMVHSKKKGGFIREMIDLYEEKAEQGEYSNILAVNDVDPDQVHKYGIVATQNDNGKSMQITEMVEKPSAEEAPSNTSITGRYIFQPEIFDYLDAHKIGAGGEIQLTDAMNEMIKDQKFYGARFSDKRYDCGSVVGYLEANLGYSLDDPKIRDRVGDMIVNLADEIRNSPNS